MQWPRRLALVALLVAGIAGAATAEPDPAVQSDPVQSDPELESDLELQSDAAVPSDAAVQEDPEPEAGEVYDPWERYNRSMFGFNDSLSRNVSEPVARAWDWVVPDVARRGLRNFFVNLAFPIRVLNTTLQLKPLATGQEILRFVLNSTVGIAGFLDPATHGALLPIHREDFGQTLGYWGVPAGPYFVFPFLGPSSVRDGFGMAADITTGALTFNAIGVSIPFFATFAVQAGNFINNQSFIVDDIKRERENALDFYAAVRNAYLQYRRNQVRDQSAVEEPAASEDDLYYWDEAETEAP